MQHLDGAGQGVSSSTPNRASKERKCEDPRPLWEGQVGEFQGPRHIWKEKDDASWRYLAWCGQKKVSFRKRAFWSRKGEAWGNELVPDIPIYVHIYYVITSCRSRNTRSKYTCRWRETFNDVQRRSMTFSAAANICHIMPPWSIAQRSVGSSKFSWIYSTLGDRWPVCTTLLEIVFQYYFVSIFETTRL